MSYKLVSYQSGREARAGILVENSVYDVAKVTGVAGYSSGLSIVREWTKARRQLVQAGKRIAAGQSRVKGTPLKRVRLLARLPEPGNLFCAGANYTDHMAEMARAQGQPPGPTMKDLGERPWHFIKTSRSSVAGPGSKVKLPPFSLKVDWEVELAAVIGKSARDVQVKMRSSAWRATPSPTISRHATSWRGRRSPSPHRFTSTGSARSASTAPARSVPGWCRPVTSPTRRTSP